MRSWSKLSAVVLLPILVASLSLSATAANDKSQGKAPEKEDKVTAKIELPSQAKEAQDKVAQDVGKPDFAVVPGNSPSTPASENSNAGGNSKSGDNSNSSGNSDSDNKPGESEGAGKPVDLTPPGIVRKIDTTQQATAKLQNVETACQTSVSSGVANPACETKTYLIRYKTGSDMEVEAKGLGTRVKSSFDGVLAGVSAELTAEDLAKLASFSTVLSIEEDAAIKVAETQSGPTWGLDRVDQAALPLSSSYTYTSSGQGVIAYVVDTGVRTSHGEFSSRILPGYSVINDGSGVEDCNGHGTHVAGTIGGSVYGIAKNVQIVPVRVLGCDGSGTLSGVVEGLSWIGNNHPAGTPAVVNLSLGGGASSSLDAAVQALIDKGITVVVAAGNSSADACQASPARVPGAITVAASSSVDAFASYSNFGSCIDLIAPGSSVKSAWYSGDTATATLSGTSMASPHVAGLVAQLLEANYVVPTEVSTSITASAVADVVTGVPAGTKNLLAQLASLTPTTPTDGTTPSDGTTPTDGSTTPGKGAKTKPAAPGKAKSRSVGSTVYLDWSLPEASANGLLSQHVHLYSFGELIGTFEVGGADDSLVIEGLSYGLGYTVTITAVNSLGESPESVQSETFRPRPLEKPKDGTFNSWTKSISERQVKIYAKYPQVGKKIQFMIQQSDGSYRELAWKRITTADLNENGEYITLTNSVYMVRTLTLKPGKNRVKILVNGKQVGATKTYSVN